MEAIASFVARSRACEHGECTHQKSSSCCPGALGVSAFPIEELDVPELFVGDGEKYGRIVIRKEMTHNKDNPDITKDRKR